MLSTSSPFLALFYYYYLFNITNRLNQPLGQELELTIRYVFNYFVLIHFIFIF